METLEYVLNLILKYGIAGFLLVALLLIVQNPERAVKLKALFFEPTFRLFKWGSRQYVASQVSYITTEFLKKYVTGLIQSLSDVKIRIKWVTSPSDPVLSKEGTLILRMQETNDQTRNVLAATRVALPHVVCTTLRTNLERYLQSAIDLTILRNLAERLGRHARPVFQRYFFAPEAEEDRRVAELFEKLVIVDNSGIFVTIFLEELNVLGDVLYASGDTNDKTGEIISFLEFLLALASREIGEYTPLQYFSSEFRVGILLLAITIKTEREGITPYIRRIDKNIQLGCESIYIVAYAGARTFSDRILNVIKDDERLSLVKENAVKSADTALAERRGVARIALLRRNTVFYESKFVEKLEASGIREGDFVDGAVIDVAQNVTVAYVSGLNAVIYRDECSWQTAFDCADFLSMGGMYKFIVRHIDHDKGRLELSRRFAEEDPWKSERMPKEGDIIEIDIVAISGQNCMGHYVDNIEVILPVYEVSWLETNMDEIAKLLNTRQKVIIYEKSEESRIIKGSIRRLQEDPWPQIHKRLPKGTNLRAAVLEVNPSFVRVQLPEDLIGIIPREAMIRGGYEYADFENSVVVGQGLDVTVSKVFIKKHKIRFELRRSVQGQMEDSSDY